MIDDSALFHGTYDPVKAREYYLRTRKLKGRKKGRAELETTMDRSEFNKIAKGNEGKYARPGNEKAERRYRREQLKKKKAALEKRLERLEQVLKELVEAAKKRSGVDKEPKKDRAPETKKDKADRNKAEKKDKPETAAEKKERAKKAKEAYEKEHPNSLSKDVEILQEQVKDIQAKIKKALEDARDRKDKAGKNNSKSGSKKDRLDGPQGR